MGLLDRAAQAAWDRASARLVTVLVGTYVVAVLVAAVAALLISAASGSPTNALAVGWGASDLERGFAGTEGATVTLAEAGPDGRALIEWGTLIHAAFAGLLALVLMWAIAHARRRGGRSASQWILLPSATFVLVLAQNAVLAWIVRSFPTVPGGMLVALRWITIAKIALYVATAALLVVWYLRPGRPALRYQR